MVLPRAAALRACKSPYIAQVRRCECSKPHGCEHIEAVLTRIRIVLGICLSISFPTFETPASRPDPWHAASS